MTITLPAGATNVKDGPGWSLKVSLLGEQDHIWKPKCWFSLLFLLANVIGTTLNQLVSY